MYGYASAIGLIASFSLLLLVDTISYTSVNAATVSKIKKQPSVFLSTTRILAFLSRNLAVSTSSTLLV